jgi:hypothetical protein
MTVTIDAGETSTADLSAYLPLLARWRNGARLQPDWSALVDDAVEVWARPGFDTLLALPRLRFEPFDYQLRAARTVLRRMRGRGILADEVGLGKTIEAGLVLIESQRSGGRFVHEPTDRGWRLCHDILAAGPPPRSATQASARWI